MRVAESGRTLLRNRAAAETDGNVSELARRVLKYGAMHMPKGWNQ